MFSNSLLISNFIVKGIKLIAFLLDHAVYWLAKVVYAAFYYLADATLLNDAIVSNFTKRIYAVIGIVMIFVLAFNLLTYIVDPDKINDKKVGASSMVKDIVIALVVLTLLPTIFTKIYALQNQVLSSGVLANVLLGGYSEEDAADYNDYIARKDSEGYSSLTDYYVQNGANNMIANVYVAFLYPKDNFTVLECGTDDGSHSDYCDAYTEAKKTGDIDAFSDLVTRDDYNYFPLISTAGGIVLLFFMFSFCLNLGKRVGKMALLQLIAPVPVVMEILPNKKGTRKTWLDMLIKTFLEVFMYLAVVYLVVFLISLVPSAVGNIFGNASGAGFVKIVVIVMLIFGLLQFGKEAPQMLFDILGIKSTGIISAAAKRGVAMAGVTGGLIGSTAGRFARNFGSTEGNRVQKMLSGFGGAASGVGRTLWGARNVHNLKDAVAQRKNINQQLTTSRINRAQYKVEHGGTLGGSISGHLADVGTNIKGGWQNYWIGDEAFNRPSGALKSLSEVKGVLDKRKKLNSDTTYSTAKTALNDRKTEKYYQEYEKFLNDYSTLKTGYAGTNSDFDQLGIDSSETGFIKYMSSPAGTSYYQGEFSDIKVLFKNMNDAETKFYNDQVNNDINVAIEMLGVASRNVELKNLTDSNGKNLVKQLGSVIDNQGNLQNGSTIDDVRTILKQIDTAQKNATIDYTRQTIYEEQKRKNNAPKDNNKNGGSGGNK